MNTENSDKVLMSTANLLIKANLKIVELQKEKKKIIFILICVISIILIIMLVAVLLRICPLECFHH
jgi:t-SNARE complex subunit (syntaxin)